MGHELCLYDGDKLNENYSLEDFIKYPVDSVIGLLYCCLMLLYFSNAVRRQPFVCLLVCFGLFVCSVVTTRVKLLDLN